MTALFQVLLTVATPSPPRLRRARRSRRGGGARRSSTRDANPRPVTASRAPPPPVEGSVHQNPLPSAAVPGLPRPIRRSPRPWCNSPREQAVQQTLRRTAHRCGLICTASLLPVAELPRPASEFSSQFVPLVSTLLHHGHAALLKSERTHQYNLYPIVRLGPE